MKAQVFRNLESKQNVDSTAHRKVWIAVPKYSLRITNDITYIPKLANSARIMSTCQVRIVRATISNSVSISEVNVIATMWMNSESNRRRAPYIIIPPKPIPRTCTLRGNERLTLIDTYKNPDEKRLKRQRTTLKKWCYWSKCSFHALCTLAKSLYSSG